MLTSLNLRLKLEIIIGFQAGKTRMVNKKQENVNFFTSD